MLAKLVAQLLLPLNLAIELWLLALLLRWRGRRRAARTVAVLGMLVLWIASTPRFAGALCRGLEASHPPVAAAQAPTADAIVVLGGSIGPALPPRVAADLTESADRILHAARLFRAGKAPIVVASGGSFRDDLPPEAPDMVALLVEWGVPHDAIVPEASSGTTRENAAETQRLLEARGVKRILLVTSALHMPRAERAFRAVGFEVVPAPTDYHAVESPGSVTDWIPDAGALDLSTSALRELMGRAYYALRGWS